MQPKTSGWPDCSLNLKNGPTAGHFLADDLSCMGLTLQYDDVYDTGKLIKFPKASFF